MGRTVQIRKVNDVKIGYDKKEKKGRSGISSFWLFTRILLAFRFYINCKRRFLDFVTTETWVVSMEIYHSRSDVEGEGFWNTIKVRLTEGKKRNEGASRRDEKRGYKCSENDTVILSMIDKRKLFEGERIYWKMEMNVELSYFGNFIYR